MSEGKVRYIVMAMDIERNRTVHLHTFSGDQRDAIDAARCMSFAPLKYRDVEVREFAGSLVWTAK